MWYEQDGRDTDIVISTRIRLARNLSDTPFPGKMSAQAAEDVILKVKKALDGQKLDFINVLTALPIHNTLLLEDHLISSELISSTSPCGVFVGENLSVMVNEEDHLRLQCIKSGYHLEEAYNTLSELDGILEKNLGYAFSEKYGYLTKCPTNAGTGMRASVMLHLPALTISENINKVINAVSKFGVTVRGMYGENSTANACIYQVSNQLTLGISEEETLKKLGDVVDMIIEKERHILKTLHDNGTVMFKDKVFRAFGILKNAYNMSTEEFMTHIPYVKMGVGAGLFENLSASELNKLIITVQPAHITNTIGEDNIRKRDQARAELLRKFFEEKR